MEAEYDFGAAHVGGRAEQIVDRELRAGDGLAAVDGEYEREAVASGRVRLDPLDPSTFRHAPACDQRDVTDPAIIRATVRVQEREGYWWVESSMCACCWQTPYLAAESVG